ncbi:helix-turn-helix transcriptional regulator [Streptomyces sp. NPDC037389]|uniref:helix-turn-helix transcriptional regulator n=1 Tax=Streptomyces sp. NPDC037389 TaxID=3155369 RepID=UPI0033C0BB51
MAWRRSGHEGGHGAAPAGARLARQTTASLAGLLAERDMTRKDLAEQLGVSPGRVSQILSGDENLTLRSLAAVAESLDATIEITFRDASGAQEHHHDDASGRLETAPASPLARSRRR